MSRRPYRADIAELRRLAAGCAANFEARAHLAAAE